MVKLSAELIEQAAQYTNPVRDRELDLRGYKIPVLENLGATLDQFDTVDFSDNEIRKLDGFPLLKRLKTLLMNNNRICRIGENLEQSLPALRELILTNNKIQELGDLEPLASVKTLTLLSLLRNPVTNKKHYRLYVVHKIPQLRVLDFQKVKLKVGGVRPAAVLSARPGPWRWVRAESAHVSARGDRFRREALASRPVEIGSGREALTAVTVTTSACGRRSARRRRKCSKANAALSWRRISPSRAKRSRPEWRRSWRRRGRARRTPTSKPSRTPSPRRRHWLRWSA
ncbi:U2 small nuclear ribonucleoprotein A'-like isoform X1 [Syngnathus acus]|uniref:U2 small nuclear ribonucleoprotein A'-like isoform X1 n=1 Tax=Syngnathus acus TaxID=161584 RepID=UPI00188649E6|nr:U2 small nuclear ribonucleoprotein A'-like isoform X1 [Syngnathus acus]